MYQLVYLSRAVPPLTSAQILDLVVCSREHNQRHHLTGILLSKAGQFMHLLEGDRPDVEALFERIERDPRHREVTVLHQGSAEGRQFPGCPLGFQDLGSAAVLAVPGFGAFLNTSLSADEFRDFSKAQKLLLLFQRRRSS
ncbi:hypothetical protein MYXO_00635 [Myxococcaceae bacterium]|nr:hypothetical protein MYXO_00635 [Myxococcaceae bacterium]